MKPLLMFFVLFILAKAGKAMCAISGIWCWPAASTIKANGILLMEFYGYSQRLVADLNRKYPVYLKSANERIPLRVEEVCKGEFELTQTLLRPQKALTAGEEYELQIDSLSRYESVPGRWNPEKKVYIPMRWKATSESDGLLPEWIKFPLFQKQTFAAFGCGPARWVEFTFSAFDQSDVLLKTTVTSLSTHKATTYYLIPEKGKVQVGHGMCSGAFHFDDGKKYEVVFELMDASGNYGCERTSPIRFTKPEPMETQGE